MGIERTIGEFVGDNEVPVFDLSCTVAQAMASMSSSRSACALVTRDKELAGIFTERDFLNRVAAARRAPDSTTLGEVMTASPNALKIDDCITYAVNLMAVGGYRNVPIVNEEGRPISNLSVYDVTSHLSALFAEMGDAEADEWTDIGGGD